jgi:hypothetical protein
MLVSLVVLACVLLLVLLVSPRHRRLTSRGIGGESTTMALLVKESGFWDELVEFGKKRPIWVN